jgi:hypothetical protein
LGNLDRDRQKRAAAAEAKAGVREGHYLLNGEFVDVWVSFYPKTQWWIADACRPRGERIKGTTRKLDNETKAKLESWL